jgi:hypothetical protein
MSRPMQMPRDLLCEPCAMQNSCTKELIMCSLVFPTQCHRLNMVNPSLAPTEHHTQAAEKRHT